MLHDIRIFCGDMQLLILAMNRKILRKFGKSTENVERLKRECLEKKKKRIESKKKKKI